MFDFYVLYVLYKTPARQMLYFSRAFNRGILPPKRDLNSFRKADCLRTPCQSPTARAMKGTDPTCSRYDGMHAG